MKPALVDHYKKVVIPEMKKRFGYANALEVPRLEKVVVNAGVGKIGKDDKILEKIRHNLELITGQHIVNRAAKKSISSFKIREGMIVGMMATMRGKRMYDFVEKLVRIVMPRIRDFRGISPQSVDMRGNLSVGIREQGIFPEIGQDNVDFTHGLQVTISTTAKTRDEGMYLLQLLGIPFSRPE